jgi:peptidoglycan-N-acetylglucosamine deacetylase
MVDPPSPYARRRAERRRQVRRRRIAGGGGMVAVLAVVIVIIATSGGGPGAHGGAGVATAAVKGSDTHRRHARANAPRAVLSADEAAGAKTAERLAKLGLPVYCGGGHRNEVAFTFDDGPGPYTTLALKKLREAHERATFFVVGRSADQFPGWLPRELKVAAIGDHTYTHPELTALPQSEVYSQIARTAQKIQAESGEHVVLFRPPYELHNAMVDKVAQQLGLLEILWNVDSADSLGANYAQITSNVEAGLRPGAIVLMHENRGQTIRALTALLPELQRRHLRSVSVLQLLADDPPSVAQLRAGPHGCGLGGPTHAASGG